jgi:sodium-coupled monocarboxylate transporter 8/12
MLPVIPVALKIFYPIYFKMELTSCYEYLGMRFGKELRILGGVLYIIQMCFYTSVAVLAPAIALSKATGLNQYLAIVLIYVVCVFYSSQGGLKAVVIADTFQAIVLLVSLLMIIGLGTYFSPGFAEIFKIAERSERLEFFNFDFNPTKRHSVWSVVIGGFFYWTALFCVNQATVQKSMSLKQIGKAKIALTLSIFGLILVFVINFYTGLMTFAHYENCDPLKSGQISAIDQLLPFYVLDVLGNILFMPGLFVAGIFAASLGTVAAALSSLSAVTLEDIIASGFNVKIKPEKGAYYAKWMSLGYGLFSFALIFVVERLGGILQATLTLNGLVGGVMLGLFCLGIFFKKSNRKGAFYGGILSLVLVVTLMIIAQLYTTELEYLPSSVDECPCSINVSTTDETFNEVEQSYSVLKYIAEISYMWYSLIGCFLTVFFGYTFSLIIETIARRRIFKISSQLNFQDDKAKEAEPTPTSYERRLSNFLTHIVHDVEHSAAKMEEKIKKVISHTSLKNLHFHHEKPEDKFCILNEESVTSVKCVGRDTGSNKLFFIGLYDEPNANDSRKEDADHGEINPAAVL